MSHEPVIRLAAWDDLHAIACLIADDGLGRGREDLSEDLPACYPAAFEAIVRDPNNEIAIMERGGGAVGCLQLITDKARADAHRF